MKLSYRIFSRLSVYCFLLLSAWSVVFYFVVLNEVNEETDDYLENYAHRVIVFVCAGYTPQEGTNTDNNSYTLTPITNEEAKALPHAKYSDEMVYIAEKQETEPARAFTTVFSDNTGQHYKLTVRIPNIDKSDLQRSILVSILLLYLLLLVLFIGINWLIFHSAMKPFYVLLDWLRHYTIGRGSTLPDLHTDTKEFKDLYEATKANIRRNEDVFINQRQFLSNASHELQTPLAICKNRLELLAERDTLNKEELAEILKTKATIDDLIRLNKTLLFLTKIENEQFVELQEISLRARRAERLKDLSEMYEHLNITVHQEIRDDMPLVCDRTLAASLIGNLLGNAFLHNYPNGHIYISLTAKQLTIANTGSPEALDKDKVFRRFYRKGEKKLHSTGLGLSIIHAICKQYHLTIQYDHPNDLHRFTISSV